MAVRQRQQLLEQRDRFVLNRFVLLAAMAVLHDRHSRTLEVQELITRPLQRRQGQRRRSSIEIDHSHFRLRHRSGNSTRRDGAPVRFAAWARTKWIWAA